MARKNYKRGDGNEHFTKMIRSTMTTKAWRALSPTAQALYPWLKLEWKGADYCNNGKIRLSVRQAAECLGVSINTASNAFHDLQAKGFIKVNQTARLGSGGNATGHSYYLMELRHTVYREGGEAKSTKMFYDWREGQDFPVVKAATNNPKGRNGK